MSDHAHELEQSYLSCCYQDPSHIDKALQAGLRAGMFKHAQFAEQWSLVCELRMSGAACDAHAVFTEASKRGTLARIGDVHGLFETERKVAGPALTAPDVLSALLDLHAKREVWSRLAKATEQLKSGTANLADIKQLVDESAEFCAGQSRTVPRTLDDVDREIEADVAAAKENKPRTDLLSWGIPRLDRYLLPIEPHEYALICARPSRGKSSMLAHLCSYNLLDTPDGDFAYFTLETTAKAVLMQMAAQVAGVNLKAMRSWMPQHYEKFNAARRRLVGSKRLHVFDQDMTLDAVNGRCRLLVSGGRKLRGVFVDYLGLLAASAPGKSLYEKVSAVSKNMVPLRKIVNCPLIAGQQLKRVEREVEPDLTDLRDSGQLEEDAHRINILHWENPVLEMETRPYTVSQPKCRDGVTTAVKGIEFHAPTTRWKETLHP